MTVLFPLLGSVSSPKKVPLDSFFKEQDRHLRRISIERSGHEGILTWGELKNTSSLGMPFWIFEILMLDQGS